MIVSMTGFGEAVVHAAQWSVRARVRTLNNRGLRLGFHLPDLISWRAADMRDIIRPHVTRGTVDIWVDISREDTVDGIAIDEDAAKTYVEKLNALRSRLELTGDIDLATLLGLPGVVGSARPEDAEEIWKASCAAVKQALEKAAGMRRLEGRALADELADIAQRVERLVDAAAERAPSVVEEYKTKLLARLKALAVEDLAVLSEEDICREVILFAERSDITEELCRLRSHLARLREMLLSDGPEGRRLEFIAQEMLREAATLAAKSNDAALSQLSVDLRTEVERIKEQVRNVE